MNLDNLQQQLVYWFTTDEERKSNTIREIVKEAENLSSDDNARSQYLLGEAYFLAGRFSAANESLEKAVLLNPLNADYIGAFALAQWEFGNPDCAEEYLKISQILDPENGQYDFVLGMLAEARRDRRSARAFYRSAIKKLEGTDLPERLRDKQIAEDAIERLRERPAFRFGEGSIPFI